MADGMRRALRPVALRLSLVCALGAGCTNDRVELGEQCPSPDNPSATTERGMDAGLPLIYATSCAPCDDPQPRLDARGCPIYVTFESCGGDICVGRVRFSPPSLDAGHGDADADLAAMEDAGGEP